MGSILKYALIITKNNKVLLQKEKGEAKLLMPGGKPKKSEGAFTCLHREIKEELGAELDEKSLRYIGKFEDVAADEKSLLTVELYAGKLKTQPKPRGEVKALVWYAAKDEPELLSPVFRNKILPYLVAMQMVK